MQVPFSRYTSQGNEWSSQEDHAEDINDSWEEAGRVFPPKFFGEAQDGYLGLNVCMAAAMQEYERPWRKCFVCQSP